MLFVLYSGDDIYPMRYTSSYSSAAVENRTEECINSKDMRRKTKETGWMSQAQTIIRQTLVLVNSGGMSKKIFDRCR